MYICVYIYIYIYIYRYILTPSPDAGDGHMRAAGRVRAATPNRNPQGYLAHKKERPPRTLQ